MTDNEIIKALECCANWESDKTCEDCPANTYGFGCANKLAKHTLDLINRLKAENDDLHYKLSGVMLSVDKWLDGAELKKDEVNRAITMREKTLQITEKQQAEIERLKEKYNKTMDNLKAVLAERADHSEAIKEFAEKITEIFTRYAHLHTHADQARADEIEAVDGTKIEMQSVWDVFTLKENEMAEYEEMNTLQENIETIAKERLLSELEKDFRLLVKEMTEKGGAE